MSIKHTFRQCMQRLVGLEYKLYAQGNVLIKAENERKDPFSYKF